MIKSLFMTLFYVFLANDFYKPMIVIDSYCSNFPGKSCLSALVLELGLAIIMNSQTQVCNFMCLINWKKKRAPDHPDDL